MSREELERNLTTLMEDLDAPEAERLQQQDESDELRRRLGEGDGRGSSGVGRESELREAMAEMQRELDTAGAELARQREECEGEKARADQVTERLALVQEHADKQGTQLRTSRVERQRLLDDATQLRNQLEREQQRAERAKSYGDDGSKSRRDVRRELAIALEENSEVRQNLGDLRERYAGLEATMVSLRRQATAQEAALQESATTTLAERDHALAEMRERLSSVEKTSEVRSSEVERHGGGGKTRVRGER